MMMEISNPITAAEQKPSKPRHRFAKGTSGNAAGRPNIGRRASELFDALSGDFGELSATDAILLRQAALLLARAERVSSIKQVDVGLRMSGEARRLLQVLRRNAPAPVAPIEVVRRYRGESAGGSESTSSARAC